MTQDFKGSLNLFGNLSLVVNATVNKLDVFAKSSGAVPDANNALSVLIPDVNGVVLRSRIATYLSGTSQFIMADATNYWGKVSDAAQFRNAYVYAIWDGTGIVWALGGYSGFKMVSTTTTATDDDFFLLEASSTYTRSNSHYCVCVGRIRYSYNTADTPDHTIQATVENSPELIYNPKSNYGYMKTLASTVTSNGADIAEASQLSLVVKQTGRYRVVVQLQGDDDTVAGRIRIRLKTGNATYASATYRINYTDNVAGAAGVPLGDVREWEGSLSNGDTIHLGASVAGAAASVRRIHGDDLYPGVTSIMFARVD